MIRWFLFFILILPNAYSAEIYLKPKAYLDTISGKMIYGKVIGLDKGIITFIGDQIPHGKKAKDLRDTFLMPGLIDCHTHVFFTQLIGDVDFEKALLREVKISDEIRIKRARGFLKQYLEHGFTSVCDLGNSGKFLDVMLKKEIVKDSAYPDLYVSGPGIATLSGQFYLNTPADIVNKEYLIVDEKTNIGKVMQDYINQNVDILKIYMDNSPGKGGISAAMTDKILNSPLAKKFKKITFHAIEKESVDKLLNYKSINIEHGTSTDWSLATPDKKIYLTMTDLPIDILKEFNYYNKVFYTGQILRAKEANKKSITLVFGTDFYFDRPELDRGEYAIRSVDAWSAASIAPSDILRAMTFNAAKSLQEENKMGVIKVGARANIIGMDRDPTKDLSSLKKINLVINKGQFVKTIVQNRPEKKK